MPASLVISLDFELFWGVFESKTIERYGPNILGAHKALPAILDLLEAFGAKATVATVGFLFFENFASARAHFPRELPGYTDPRFSPYLLTDPEGPHYFAPATVADLLQRHGRHEVATHTFSHYFCRQPGQTPDQFRQDLLAALATGAARGRKQISIVFPRNQIDSRYLEICRELGLRVFRGNQVNWLYRTNDRKLPGRILRLLDSYLNLSGPNCHHAVARAGLVDVPASAYLRPHSPRFPWLDRWQRRRICRAMTTTAQVGQIYHLWWHPHNFGCQLKENLANLEAILTHFKRLQGSYGMVAKTMGEFADVL